MASSAVDRIAVIGGGPAAMFFCHALEIQRKEFLSKGRDVSHFPLVTCFEKSEGPGGVWRSDRTTAHSENNDKEEKKMEDDGSYLSSPRKRKVGEDCGFAVNEKESSTTQTTANMYSGLWTNGPKEMFEFADYTFEDHFGHVRMPTHLPRKFVLDYLLKRCTRDCPSFFDRYFSFRTTVLSVKQLANGEGFSVCTFNEVTQKEETTVFDKCIWACGANGHPFVPKHLVETLQQGGFKGRIVHSSDTSTFREDVMGKNVLMVGGGLSAEDLALMAIKEGVNQIHCTFRQDTKEMNHPTRWPYDKVKVYPETTLVKCSGTNMTLRECWWDVKYQKYKTEKEGTKTILRDIDTVIFCTGYNPNVQMLETALQEPIQLDQPMVPIPEDWRMIDNELTNELLGTDHPHIVPDQNAVLPDDTSLALYRRLYKGVFWIDNPKMMYIVEAPETHVPLTELDVVAWFAAKVVTHQITLPSKTKMEADNLDYHMEMMQNPTRRYYMDWKFSRAIEKAVEGDDGEGSMSSQMVDLWEKLHEEAAGTAYFRMMGRFMNHCGYPVSFLDADGVTFSEYHRIIMLSYWADDRDMAKIQYDDETKQTEEDGSSSSINEVTSSFAVTRPGWMTFRDNPGLEKCTSYFSGITSCSLPKPWVLLSENDQLW